MHPSRRALAVVLLLASFAASLPAQRGKPTLEWQAGTAALDYGAVQVGQHGLSELKVGDQWRLGMGDATRLSLQMPALVGDSWVPPGEYRLRLVRLEERKCAVVVQGSGFALGGEDARMPGDLDKTDKPTKKLVLDWHKGASKDKTTLPVDLLVQFGETQWQGALQLAGSKTQKCNAYELTVFALPAAAVEQRGDKPIVLASLHKKSGPESTRMFNVVLAAKDSKLAPWVVVPADNFAELKGPADQDGTTGKVATAPATGTAGAFVELRSAALQKGTFELQFAAGKDLLTLSLPEPAAKGK
jgi:hypothetical protein